jgi:TolB protein
MVGLLLLLALGLGATCASSSGPGDRIVFVATVDGDQEIFLVDPATAVVTRLTDHKGRDFGPRWSPDRKQIVYLSEEAGGLQINLVSQMGGSTTRLTRNVVTDAALRGSPDPRWSPDGKRLAFISEKEGNPDVYLVKADGSGLTRITSNAVEDRLGDWSPDGEWLVFYIVSPGAETGLWLRNPDGVNVVHPTQGQDSQPAWSPDGRHIAFVRTASGNADIYVVSKQKDGTWEDNTQPVRLTRDKADDLSPAWAADSKTLAFVSKRNGNADIYTIGPDGSNERQLTKNAADDLAPVWSRDGKRIAFVSRLYGPGEIFMMEADGSKQRRLTNNASEDDSPNW